MQALVHAPWYVPFGIGLLIGGGIFLAGICCIKWRLNRIAKWD
jgi:hypothetical protein